MTKALYFYDDARAQAFEPFASSRPVSELRAGIALIRERWTEILAPTGNVCFVAGDRHADFDEEGAAHAATGTIPAGSIIVNSRFVPALVSDLSGAARRAAPCSVWRCGEQLVAMKLRDAVDVASLTSGTLALDNLNSGTGSIGEMKGRWLENVWDLIRDLPEQLAEDIDAVHGRMSKRGEAARLPAHVTVLGDHAVIVGDATVVIEPHVVLDVTNGPILIERGAHVHAFTRVTGPCYIGRRVTVLGGDVSACSIGDVCKVRGEISNTIMLAYSNKGHDGFVGHSYLGRWVNLGAGTVTSNLKNTYGTVSLWTPTGVRDTGLQFLGTLFGDHVKTGIGLTLTTGTVLGLGSNVYGNMPPKAVEPFAWGGGSPYAVYQAGKFTETAARAMARRHVELSERGQRHLAAAHARRWSVEPKGDGEQT